MERRDDDAPRISRPQKHGRKWRVPIDTGNRRGGASRKRRYRTFATWAAADAYVANARDQAQGRAVSAAVEAFCARKVELGKAPATIESYEDRLRLVLGSMWERPLRAIATRGAELYQLAQVKRAADTHRNALSAAKQFGRWCTKQGWLPADPFADVEPVGRKALGADKPQLTVDESERLDAWCRARPGDPDAAITLGYLLLGTRASELVRRDCRDVDAGGALLWVRETKTAAGRRRLLVPPELGAMLVELAAGRPPDAPLFAHADGARWSRHVAYGRVRRSCKAAGVPVLPPQALRRTQSTMATDAGATGLEVARQLGHAVPHAPAVTHRSYVAPEAARDAQAQRAFRVIAGGRR
jgi:integrase